MTDRSAEEEGRGRRQVAMAMLLVSAIVVPRSIAISQAHTESYDDQYHRVRGLAFLARDLASVDLAPDTLVNDPPLGEGIVALPMFAANLATGRKLTDAGIYDHRWSPELLLGLLAAWKALLFLPMVGVAFAWCRATYGTRSAWLAAGLLAIEPNIAAHIPTGALDIVGVEAILIACFLAHRSFQDPTRPRQVAAGIALAAALAIKHTAIILPAILGAYALIRWGWEPWRDRRGWAEWAAEARPRIVATVRTLAVAVVALWALLLFDVSPAWTRDLQETLNSPSAGPVNSWPGGSYLRAVENGLTHNHYGHAAYLLGERSHAGWWYYFEVVALYKMPIGVGAILLLGIASLAWDRPRRGEWWLAIPAVAYLGLSMVTKINIGFRHFLPAYVFLLLMATRCVSRAGPRRALLAWSFAAVAGIHAACQHPDYLSYINGPWSRPDLAISDSNLDWGQGLKQVRGWIDARPRDGKKVAVAYFGNGTSSPAYYLGDRATIIRSEDTPPPTEGLLIVSPVFVAGPYDRKGNYARFRDREPVAVIGHSLLVFDLDRPAERVARK